MTRFLAPPKLGARATTAAPLPPPSLERRQCACPRTGGSCSRCAARHADGPRAGPHDGAPDLSVVHAALEGSGRPLNTEMRNVMEARFRRSFGDVRVHDDTSAARANRALASSAFTVGRQVAFAERDADATAVGTGLVAHELAHVVQQTGASPPPRTPLRLGGRGGPFEAEADRTTARVLNGGRAPPLTSTGLVLQRAPAAPPAAPAAPRGPNFTGTQRALLAEARQTLKPKPGAIVGVLLTEDGAPEFLQSGGGQGFSSHIEGKATAFMNERGIRKATLICELEPCQICDRSVYSQDEGLEKPLKSTSTGKDLSRQTPKINSALPIDSEITIVGPESTGIYRGTNPDLPRPRPRAPSLPPPASGPPPEPGGTGGGLNTPPPKAAAPSLEAAMEAERAGPLKPAVRAAVKPGGAPGRAGRLGVLALEGAASLAVELAMLAALVVWELVVVPRLAELQNQIQNLLFELEQKRKKQLQQTVQRKFELYESKHLGRILKACYLTQLRSMQAAGRKAYVNAKLNVVFEDTSDRFQWFGVFGEKPPETLFDLEVHDVDLMGVTVSDKPAEIGAGELKRVEASFGRRDKSYLGNNPLWEQTVAFSFEAPTAEQIEKEFGQEPDDCLTTLACFIATACYQSPLAEEVDTLRRFRDRYLSPSRPGRVFIRAYYKMSPPIADVLRRVPAARWLVRTLMIGPIVSAVRPFCPPRGIGGRR